MRLLTIVLKPFTALYAAAYLILWDSDDNVIKSGKMLTGKRKAAICKQFELAKLKKIQQMYKGSTMNDVVMALSSVSLKEYLEKHNDPN